MFEALAGFTNHKSLIKGALAALVMGLLAACAPLTIPDAPVVAEPEAATTTDVDATQETATDVVESTPVAVDEAAAPVKLAVPELGLDLPIQPMDWVIVVAGEERVTRWEIPDEALGWHVNSAGAGAMGNTLLSGHQVKGDALLAPLARGEFTVGQELLLTDEAGNTFVYRMTRISDPLPVAGAGAEENAEAADYIGATDSAALTLITGWPDFTTTHRIFAQAELVGRAAE